MIAGSKAVRSLAPGAAFATLALAMPFIAACTSAGQAKPGAAYTAGEAVQGAAYPAGGASRADERRAVSVAGRSALPTRVVDQHNRPMLHENGRTLLWAGGGEVTGEAETDWFDLTDSSIDPEHFQYGVGRDSIPSIDDPVFARPGDPLLAERGITGDSDVLGVVLNGIARAYPVDVMDFHEIVNDRFGDKPYAVLW